MKTRSGFVSNSSSTSFVVAITPGKSKIKISFEIDLASYAEKITTLKELREHYTDYYGLDPDATIFEEGEVDYYYEAKKQIENGKHFLFGSFASDTGNAKESFLCENGIPEDPKNKNLIIIRSEEGY